MEITILKELSDSIFDRIRELTEQLGDGYVLEKCTLESVINSGNTHLFIAREGEYIIGILTFVTYTIPTGTKAWIEDVVTDSEYRGKGIGEKLVLAALSLAETLGIKQINLTSRPSRLSANKLYTRLGFEKYETNIYRYTIR